jgi:chromosome transmission fidelity protein 18
MCFGRKTTTTTSESHKPSNLVPEDTLWVDRYRPRKFTELLGNERVARETMAWVKQWDWCVFGKRKSKKRMREDDENYNPDDEYHRPREKVVIHIIQRNAYICLYAAFNSYC